MENDFTKLIKSAEYEETEDEEKEFYEDFEPRKMTKREFVREMLRLQEEKKLYYN